MTKKKIKNAIIVMTIALSGVMLSSSFTTTDESGGGRQKATLGCPLPSLKTVEGCISGSTTCTPSGFC